MRYCQEEFTKAGQFYLAGSVPKKYENLLRLLPLDFKAFESSAESHYIMLRNIIDFVSGMTDRHALSLYRKIKGISLG